MPFTGKATYSAGFSLPELAEDVSDIIGIVGAHETPLLDHLGDAKRSASSTVHEWLEDALWPNTDAVSDGSIADGESEATFGVATPSRFRVGDVVRVGAGPEVVLVTAVAGGEVTVVRGYGGTAPVAIGNGTELSILGNAALEGDDAPSPRQTSRVRRQNYTQIFTAGVEVSGSQLAAQPIGVADELDYQKQERLRELVRDLENCVINGVAASVDPQGGATTRRTMRGIVASLTSNVFVGGADGFPAGETVGGLPGHLTEEQVNAGLRSVWERSGVRPDTIVVGGFQKRRINGFVSATRRHTPESVRFRDLVSVYESDFGVCRVVMSRWVPADSVLLLDASRLAVLPLAGRSFHFKRLAALGDREAGQVIGEYTLELHNENAHGLIRGLAAG